MHDEHMFQVNVRSRKRVKYRQNKKDAVENAEFQAMLLGKTNQEQDIIRRQYRQNYHAKQNQDKIDRDLKEQQEGQRYNEIMRNATKEEARAIRDRDRAISNEELRKDRIADDELDREIENLEKVAKEGVKHSGMFIPNPGQYRVPVQYSLVPSQSPVTVQVWSC